MRVFAAIVVVAGLAGSAHGNVLRTYTGNGGPLVDNGLARFEIFVPEHGVIKSFDTVSLIGFNHTWAGDLTITLTHKDNGLSVTLLDRPGFPLGTFGDSADFNGTTSGPYNWADGGFVYDTDFFGATVTQHALGPVAGALADFVGKDKYGYWSLTILDSVASDTGVLGSWSLTLQNVVPGPGALALLGMLGFRRRRRR